MRKNSVAAERRNSCGDNQGFAPPLQSLAHFRSVVKTQVVKRHAPVLETMPEEQESKTQRPKPAALSKAHASGRVSFAKPPDVPHAEASAQADRSDGQSLHRSKSKMLLRNAGKVAARCGPMAAANIRVDNSPTAQTLDGLHELQRSHSTRSNLSTKSGARSKRHHVDCHHSEQLARDMSRRNRPELGDVTDRSHQQARPSRNSNLSGISESASQIASMNRPHQYTLDTLRDMMVNDVQYVGATVDRAQLIDQLEWDVGVEGLLRSLKDQQIMEQIAMDRRHERTQERGRRSIANVRNSVQRWSAGGTSLLASSAERTTKLLASLFRHADDDGANNDQSAAAQKRRASVGTTDGSDAARAMHRVTNKSPHGSTDDTCVGCQRSRQSALNKRLGIGDDDARSTRKPGPHTGSFGFNSDGRSRSRRSLFEGLANTAEMSKNRWYILSANGTKLRCWESLTQIFIFCMCVLEPVNVSRIFDDVQGMEVLSGYFDLHLTVDMFLHFFTAYDDDLRDIQVTSLSYIFHRYTHSWFLIDLLTVLPIDRFASVSGAGSDVTHAMRMIKILTAHRLISGRSQQTSLPGSTALNPSLMTLWKLILTVIFVWHWTACIYWALVRAPETVLVLDESDTWSPPELVLRSNSSTIRYAFAMNWAIGITTQTSFPAPSTLRQFVFGAATTILGFLMMSLIIGSATTALSDLQAQRSEISMRLQHIDRYMKYKRLPKLIRQRVVSFYRFQYTSMNRVDESDVLVGLPRALRMQMSLIMHKPIFVQLPLFWLCSEEEILLITQRLRPCVIMPGEMLIKEERLGVGLFLLMKGAVESLRKGELLVVLLAVAAFGENALRDQPSNVSIRALRFCETTVLLREDFAIVEELNPMIRRWLDIYILERDRKLADPCTRRQSILTKMAAVRAAKSQQWCTSSQNLFSNRPYSSCSTRLRPIRTMMRMRRNAKMSAHRRMSVADAVAAKRTQRKFVDAIRNQGEPEGTLQSWGSWIGRKLSTGRRGNAIACTDPPIHDASEPSEPSNPCRCRQVFSSGKLHACAPAAASCEHCADDPLSGNANRSSDIEDELSISKLGCFKGMRSAQQSKKGGQASRAADNGSYRSPAHSTSNTENASDGTSSSSHTSREAKIGPRAGAPDGWDRLPADMNVDRDRRVPPEGPAARNRRSSTCAIVEFDSSVPSFGISAEDGDAEMEAQRCEDAIRANFARLQTSASPNSNKLHA